jgi:hypothetical protein
LKNNGWLSSEAVRFLDPFLTGLSKGKKADGTGANPDHRESWQGVPLHLVAQLAAVELDRSCNVLDGERQTSKRMGSFMPQS